MFHTTDELLATANPTWLIYKVLPEEGLAMLYGAPGSGKSFVALDWALSVATGISWRGQRVKQGHVAYIAAEGESGLKKRVAAWLLHQEAQCGVSVLPDAAANALWFLGCLDCQDADELTVFMESLEARFPGHYTEMGNGHPVLVDTLDLKLVVVDTLSRNFGGQDENSSIFMPQFIATLSNFAKRHKLLVLVIHHTNALGSRERGHSSLRGGIETSFECAAYRDDLNAITQITLNNDKQKDDGQVPEMAFAVRCIELPELGRDEEGEVLTSLVLEQDDTTSDRAMAAIREVLIQEGAVNQTHILEACKGRVSRQQLKVALKLMIARGDVSAEKAGGKNNETLYALRGQGAGWTGKAT